MTGASTVMTGPSVISDDRFYFRLAMIMAGLVVLGFGTQLAMGRSSFHAPIILHAHAVVFMAWVALYLIQTWAVAHGRLHWHRRLGWIALVHVPLMIVLGFAVTMALVRAGRAPFFFIPQHFLVVNPLTLLCFAGLTAAAILRRRRADWHKRLHLCAMAALMGPAFGRLLPMPLLMPLGYELAALAGLLFPLAAMLRETRRGALHPAWRWGLPALPLTLILAAAIGYSSLGGSIYAAITAGAPGARVAPLSFAPPP